MKSSIGKDEGQIQLRRETRVSDERDGQENNS